MHKVVTSFAIQQVTGHTYTQFLFKNQNVPRNTHIAHLQMLEGSEIEVWLTDRQTDGLTDDISDLYASLIKQATQMREDFVLEICLQEKLTRG